jgi:hypothetical protein
MKHSRTALVYLLQAGKFYKIGVTTTTIKKRITELQTGNPMKIKYVHYENMNNTKKMFSVESLLHKEYSKKRMEGEWFNLTIDEANQIVVKMKAFRKDWVLTDYLKIKQEIYRTTPTKRHKNKNTIKNMKQKAGELKMELNSLLMKNFNAQTREQDV